MMESRSKSPQQASLGNSGNRGNVRQPQNPTVDTSSIYAKGVTPSAVYHGVSRGEEDALSKYRVTSPDQVQDIDWIKTLRSASRAQVEEPGEVFSVKSQEQVVHNPQQQVQSHNTRPQNAPPPSQQIRREDVFSSRPPNSAINVRPQQHNVYQGPPRAHSPYQSTSVTVEESTIRPSVLRDSGDPLEKFRIKPEELNDINQTSQPKTVFKKQDSNDSLDRFRVKSAEEEEKTWHLYMMGLTADPGKPIELRCDGQLIYTGEGLNGVVNAHSVYEAQGPVVNVVLHVKSLNFVVNRSLELSKGRFVRFSVERGQMKFRQQKTEFED
jgi:hypothetical protein